MDTRIQADNPYGNDRYGFAWQQVPAGGTAHLDFGCGDGRFLAVLRSKSIGRLMGIDGSEEAVKRTRDRYPGLDVRHLGRTIPLPFADGEFSSISLMDVLEHVDEQDALLGELYRVLQDDGVLIVTVPGHHVFSFLDLGNLKFLFPRLHRWYYCRRHSPQEYKHRYVSNADALVGDISATKRWHEHFSRRQEDLLQRWLFRRSLRRRRAFPAGPQDAEMTVGRIGPLRSIIRSHSTGRTPVPVGESVLFARKHAKDS